MVRGASQPRTGARQQLLAVTNCAPEVPHHASCSAKDQCSHCQITLDGLAGVVKQSNPLGAVQLGGCEGGRLGPGQLPHLLLGGRATFRMTQGVSSHSLHFLADRALPAGSSPAGRLRRRAPRPWAASCAPPAGWGPSCGGPCAAGPPGPLTQTSVLSRLPLRTSHSQANTCMCCVHVGWVGMTLHHGWGPLLRGPLLCRAA